MKALVKKIIPAFLMQEYRNYRKLKQAKSYQGNKVLCPICNSNFTMFLPYGSPKRENAQCMVCGSRERHRLLFIYLGKKTNLFDNEAKIRLLHFAPEKCFYDLFRKNKISSIYPATCSRSIIIIKEKLKFKRWILPKSLLKKITLMLFSAIMYSNMFPTINKQCQNYAG